MTFVTCLINGKALSIHDIFCYESVLIEINNEYKSYLYILSEKEFNDSQIKEKFQNSYEVYIDNICSIDIDEFKRENMIHHISQQLLLAKSIPKVILLCQVILVRLKIQIQLIQL